MLHKGGTHCSAVSLPILLSEACLQYLAQLRDLH